MKNKPIKGGFKFWFRYGCKSGYLYQFDMYLGKKSKTEFGLGESVVLSLCENLKNSYCYVFFDNFFTSPNLMLKLFEDGIYATGTVRSNRKHMPTLKADKQMKRSEHDWMACDTISATKWMDSRTGGGESKMVVNKCANFLSLLFSKLFTRQRITLVKINGAELKLKGTTMNVK